MVDQHAHEPMVVQRYKVLNDVPYGSVERYKPKGKPYIACRICRWRYDMTELMGLCNPLVK